MTILAKQFCVKLNGESIFLYEGMWPTFFLIIAGLPMSDNVHMHHSHNQLTRWVGGNKTVHVGKEVKQTLLCNLITEIILMQVYNMAITAKDFCVNFCTIVYHTLVTYYHGHCSNTYLLISMVLRQWDHKILKLTLEGGTWEGKTIGGWE